MNKMIKKIKYFGVDRQQKLMACEMNELRIGQDEEVIKVNSIGINRADLLQKGGKYPPPDGASPILGLECSGYLSSSSSPVMALLSGGAYSQYVSAHSSHIIPLSTWGGVMEVWLTALMLLGHPHLSHHIPLKPNKVMVYAGASAVGTTLIQLLLEIGCDVYCTVSSTHKQEWLSEHLPLLPLSHILNYKESTNEQMLSQVQPHSFQQVYDCVGASNYSLTCKLLSTDSRWILYGLLGGPLIPNFNLLSLLSKRVTLSTHTLRSQSDSYKAHLIQLFQQQHIQQKINDGTFKVIIDSLQEVDIDTQGAQQVEHLHQRMANNQNIGKLIFTLKQ